MRHLLFALLAALMLAPLAAAQDEPTKDENATRPDDAAWVEDCPPDMMCAAGGADEPRPYGEEGCIECSGPAPADASSHTCMDGAQENETCRDDVQYFGGEPTRGPADGSCENCRGEETTDDVVQPPEGAEGGITSVQDEEKSAVPAPGLALIVAAFGLAVVLVARKL